MTQPNQGIYTQTLSTPPSCCSKRDVACSIGVALGIIVALAGVLTWISVAHPQALGPLNALSHLTNWGGSALFIAGCVIIPVALNLSIPTKKSTSSAPTSSRGPEPSPSNDPSPFEQELHQIAKLAKPMEGLVDYVEKYQDNQQAMDILRKKLKGVAIGHLLLCIAEERIQILPKFIDFLRAKDIPLGGLLSQTRSYLTEQAIQNRTSYDLLDTTLKKCENILRSHLTDAEFSIAFLPESS